MFIDFLEIVLDMAVDIIDVADGFGLDVFGSVGVSKGVLCFVKVYRAGTDTDDHDGSAVAAQTEFEETGEFTVAVWHMVLLARVAQGIDT